MASIVLKSFYESDLRAGTHPISTPGSTCRTSRQLQEPTLYGSKLFDMRDELRRALTPSLFEILDAQAESCLLEDV